VTLARPRSGNASDDEEGFFVERRRADETAWRRLAILAPNTTAYVDDTALPDQDLRYRVCTIRDLATLSAAVTVGTPPSPANAASKSLITSACAPMERPANTANVVIFTEFIEYPPWGYAESSQPRLHPQPNDIESGTRIRNASCRRFS